MVYTTADGRRIDTARDLSAAERHVLMKLLAWRDLAGSAGEFRERTRQALARGWNDQGPVRPGPAMAAVIKDLERRVVARLEGR